MVPPIGDRRIHRVFVTRHTEYHLRRDVCIAVRDRRSGRWLPEHQAVLRKVTGTMLRIGKNGFVFGDGLPEQGESLVFEAGSGSTSPVTAVERPPASVVRAYPRTD